MTDNLAIGQDAPQEDTAIPQTNEASEQQTQTPEATQDQVQAQEAQTPETKAEDTVQEQLLAGKFKTPEEVVKAYEELQSKFTATAQEKAELSRILDEAFASPEPLVAADTEAYAYEEPAQADSTTDKKLAVLEFLVTNDNLDKETLQNMTKVIQNDPIAKQIPTYEAKLKYAQAISQNMAQSQAIATARAEGAQQVQVKTAEKQAAQVESAVKSAPVDKNTELMERMRAGDKSARTALISEIPAVQEMRRQAGLE